MAGLTAGGLRPAREVVWACQATGFLGGLFLPAQEETRGSASANRMAPASFPLHTAKDCTLYLAKTFPT